MARGFSNLSEERLFELFRNGGVPKHLAEVFDRTAPELLRVALHLAPGPAQADDLVQGTFLKAIEQARTWDASRPLLPWLMGILTNLARYSKRQEGRALDAERLRRPRPTDPAHHAETVEFTRAIDDAIADLSEVYRPVLVLHLRHGLGPVEIANALGRPAGTVRSQLARGLEKLRGLLPLGFAVGFAGMLTPSRGLAAIREAVLAKAAVTPTAFALPTIGALAMKKTLATVAVAMAAITVWMVWPDGSAEEPASGAVSDLEESARGVPRAGRISEADADATTRTEVVVDREETRTGSVMVRVVWDEIGTPAGGVGVRMQPVSAGDALLREQELRTDTGGEALFTKLHTGAVRILIDRAPGREVTVDAGRTSLVEVTLASSRSVHGIVVDDNDQPIVGASLWVSEMGWADQGSVVTRTDADGLFQLRGVERNFLLAAFADGFRPCAPQQLGESEVLRLHLTRDAAVIAGQVTDQRGEPIASALVRIGLAAPLFFTFAESQPEQRKLVTNPPALTVRTDHFGFYRSGSAPVGDAVKVFARAADFVGRVDEVQLRSGETTRHDIVLERGCEVFGVVTVAGSPGTGVDLWTQEPSHMEPTWLHPATRSGQGGSYRLTGVPPGIQRIVADGRERGSVVALIGLLPEQPQRWDPALGAGPRITGRIVDPEGSPQRGLRLELAREGSGQGSGRRSETDDDGRFSFEDCPDGAHELRISDPRSPMSTTLWSQAGLRPGGDPLELVVDLDALGAWITGLALGPDGLPVADAQLRLRNFSVAALGDSALDPNNGRFRIGPLPAGEYEFELISSLYPPVEIGRHELQSGEVLDVGSHQFEQGGQLHVHVLDPRGRMPDKLEMLLLGADDRVVLSPLMLGGYYETPLPVGEYRLTVRGRGLAVTSVPVVVKAGEIVQKNLELETGHEVQFRLHGLPPEELASRAYLTAEVYWSGGDGALLGQGSYLFRDLERLTLAQNFPDGKFRVRVETSAGLKGEASFEVRSPTGQPVELWLHR